MRKTIFSLFVYLLITAGAALMLLPFAWMVSTSFKTRSEVETWPPKWTSKNFSRTWDVKVKLSRSSAGGIDWKGLTLREALVLSRTEESGNILSIQIDDDPVYRGTMVLSLSDNFSYLAGKLDDSQFKEFSQRLLQRDLPEQIGKLISSSKNAEEFFSNFFAMYLYGSEAILDRRNYISQLEKTIETSLNQAETFERYSNRLPEEYKQEYIEMISDGKKLLNERLSELSILKKGSVAILQTDEISMIDKSLKNTLNILQSNELFENLKDNALMRLYKARVISPVEDLLNLIEVYTFVREYFKSVQIQKADTRQIVFSFLSKKEKDQLLKEYLSMEHFSADVEKIIQFQMNQSIESLPENVEKLLDERLYEEFKSLPVENIRIYIQQLKQVLSSLSGILSDMKISSLDQFESYEKMLEFFEDLSLNQTAQIALEKLGNLSKVISKDVFWKMAVILYDNVQQIAKLRKIYSQVQNSMKLLQAPDFVKNVRLKQNQTIEIELNNVHPVYLEDDNYTLRVNFSFAEMLANIFHNYVTAWKSAPFGVYYINTAFVSTVTTILEVIIAAMAAYAFALMNFPGKNLIFALFLGTMMIPGEVLLVPNFITISKLGWIDTYYALIIPWVVSVFAIFLMRQHFLTLPRELQDAARIDGCSHFRFLWTVVVPISKPVVITSALLKFVGSWNAFLWVLIVTNKDKFRTLPVGLQTFSSDVGTIYNQLMAAATFSILPVIVLFLFTQKYFIRGIARTGLK